MARTSKTAATQTSAATEEKKTTKRATSTSKTSTEKKATTAKKPAAEKVSKTAAKTVATAPTAPSPEQRYQMIEVAAYYLAEKNGFQGCTADYWRQAEAQIDAQLAAQ